MGYKLRKKRRFFSDGSYVIYYSCVLGTLAVTYEFVWYSKDGTTSGPVTGNPPKRAKIDWKRNGRASMHVWYDVQESQCEI